ncbi:unnamed protein product [Mytilus coruscus]|uniref:Uncharacterized protein n=1 Tax=Mytilus coruscus TaxID=42192 RepID=A0A6J8C1E7_MYTCO|nr:unnamed protein product [Mytilus coruscus]
MALPNDDAKTKPKRAKKRHMEQTIIELQLAESKANISNLEELNREYRITIDILSVKLGIPSPMGTIHIHHRHIVSVQYKRQLYLSTNYLEITRYTLYPRTLDSITRKGYYKKIINNDFISYVKAVDDDNPIIGHRTIREYRGTAMFWNKDLEKSINIMPDGNNRIKVIKINSSPLKTCLVNVYMPSLQVVGDLDYKDKMDQISEIIENKRLLPDNYLRGHECFTTQR